MRLKLYKGNVIPVGRKSLYSLYREDFATFGQDSVYDQSDAAGFITLFGLPLKVAAMRDIAAGTKIEYRIAGLFGSSSATDRNQAMIRV